MYAIVEIAGKQFRVEKDQTVKVPYLHAEDGSKLVFDRVLLYTDDAGQIKIGQPVIEDMQVTATLIENGREKKIIVFKKKRRKGYRKKNGHRQDFSKIKIENIAPVKAAKAKAKAEAKEEKAETAAKKAPAQKAAAKPKTAKKTAAKEKPAEGKEA